MFFPDMMYWLLKTESETYSWNDLIKEERGCWDGVRNYQARNNLQKMKKGDLAFFYHSGKEKEIVGIVKIIKEAYPDPTTNEKQWVAVDVKALKKLQKPISLKEIKDDKKLHHIALVKQSRLSVMPLAKIDFEYILSMRK